MKLENTEKTLTEEMVSEETESVISNEAETAVDSMQTEPEKIQRREGEEFVDEERLAYRREGEARRRAIEAEFRKINAIDPSVKSFDDLMLMENADEFAEKVRKGYSLADAFILTNGKKLSQRIKAAAVKTALSRLAAKQHLTGAGTSGGEAAIDVPAETYSLYKSLYPSLSDSEIKRHYKKHNK